jgi:hypothetical protein
LLEVVVLEGSTAEGVVLDEEDGRVDGEPVGEDDEERIEGILERVVTDFGKDDVFEMEGREKKGGIIWRYLPNAWNESAKE